jgi:folate-binding protein YgfZ
MNTDNLAAARRALYEGALILRAPALGTLAITGKDRQTWLNGLVTCDVAPRRSGDGVYGFAVGKNGKILAEVRILLDDERILIGAPRERIEGLMQHFDRYVIMEDVTIEDASTEVTWALAHGPFAPNLVALARAHGAVAAASVDMSGKGGALVALDPANADTVIDRLLKEKGAPVELGDDAWNRLHVEVGLAEWGVDFSDENYPQEASLENLTVSFQKGCYLGQEAVFMLQMRGHVKKKIVRLDIEGDSDIAAPTEITAADGTSVGSVTSSAPNPDKPSVIALGYVKWKHAQSGTELAVAGRKAVVAQ